MYYVSAPSNLDSWFSADGNDVEVFWDSPLFLRSLSAHMSFQSLQVCTSVEPRLISCLSQENVCVDGLLRSTAGLSFVARKKLNKK